MTQMKLDKDVREIVTETVTARLRAFGLDRVNVELGPDHDGDTSIIIDIYYRPVVEKVEPRSLTEMLFQIREKLWDAGEERFPYIRHHFDEKAA